MARCNPELMDQFTCEELLEKRKRIDLAIGADQTSLERTNSRIHRNRSRIANNEARIQRLRGELPTPSLHGPLEMDDNRKPKTPGFVDIFLDSAEEIARQIRNRQEIQRLNSDIDRLERDIQYLLLQQTRQQQSLNEALEGRECIQQARRRKGCLGV